MAYTNLWIGWCVCVCVCVCMHVCVYEVLINGIHQPVDWVVGSGYGHADAIGVCVYVLCMYVCTYVSMWVGMYA